MVLFRVVSYILDVARVVSHMLLNAWSNSKRVSTRIHVQCLTVSLGFRFFLVGWYVIRCYCDRAWLNFTLHGYILNILSCYLRAVNLNAESTAVWYGGVCACVFICAVNTHWSGQSRTLFPRTQIRRKVDSPRSIHLKHEKSTRAISVCEWNTHHHHHDHRPQSTRESGVSTWIWANKIYRLTPRAANAKSVRNACGLGCIYDVHT